MIRITLDKGETDAASAALSKLAAKAQNISGGLKNIGEALNQTHRERFEREQAPDGAKWAPLTGWTLASKTGPGILRESGALLGSMNYSVSGNTLEHGFNSVYAATHQFGDVRTIRPKKPGGVLAIPAPPGTAPGADGKVSPLFRKSATIHIPARPFSGWGPLEEEAAMEAVEEWLEVEGGDIE